MSPKGSLYLLPNTLGETASVEETLPSGVFDTVRGLTHFIVETPKAARRYLIALGLRDRLNELQFHELNKHTAPEAIPEFLEPALQGESIGVISDAGCPGIADPGSAVVQYAHQQRVTVVPLTGPSSIFLALMGSGFNGQQFTFHGYLPHDKGQRRSMIRKMEAQAGKGYTQIFMETPFRNEKLVDELIASCSPNTSLCIAAGLTLPNGFVRTQPVRGWQQDRPEIHKVPAVFLLGGG